MLWQASHIGTGNTQGNLSLAGLVETAQRPTPQKYNLKKYDPKGEIMSTSSSTSFTELHNSPIVLTVEPDVLVRLAVSAYLRECGYRVIEAGTADEAMRVFESEMAIDVALIEVATTGCLDGFALAQPFPHTVIEDLLLGDCDEVSSGFPGAGWPGWANRGSNYQPGKSSCRELVDLYVVATSNRRAISSERDRRICRCEITWS